MRRDLNKQLCEHERSGGGKYHYVRADVNRSLDEEMFQTRRSLRSAHVDRKEFSENLNPLFGWVQKCVGRKWDDCYSELCANFDKRSVINQHILQHLFQYLEIKTVLIDNQVCVCTEFHGVQSVEDDGCAYYVHPVTNIVTKNRQTNWRIQRKENQKQRQAEELKTRRVIDADTELARPILHTKQGDEYLGPWHIYHYVTVRGSPYIKLVQVWDYINNRPQLDNTGQSRMVAVTMYRYPILPGNLLPDTSASVFRYADVTKQASKKEMKRYGVTNEA